jgi:hypothetical protein
MLEAKAQLDTQVALDHKELQDTQAVPAVKVPQVQPDTQDRLPLEAVAVAD